MLFRSADLEARYGPMLAEGVPAARWSYAIIPDRQTESEAQTGKPPSYMVAVTNIETDKTDVVRADDGKPLRYRWAVPDAEVEEAVARREARHFAAESFMRRDTFMRAVP